jgi:hypothetical protein
LTLVHERLPTSDLQQAHAAGWETMLGHLSSRFGRPA